MEQRDDMDLDERIDAIINKYRFEPIRDPDAMRRQIESEVRAEVRKAEERGELKIKPGHEMKIEVRLGPPELGPPLEVRIGAPAKKPDEKP
jgi:hypothetical protein